MSTVNNNLQVQAGGRTALLPDSPMVFIGGQRFRVQVLKNGRFEDSHIDSRHLDLVQKTYARMFDDMSTDAQDRIAHANANREVVLLDHTRDGEISSLSTVSRDAYDQGMLLPSADQALGVDDLFRRFQDRHTPELKAIGQALRAEPLRDQPQPENPPSFQNLCGLSDRGMQKFMNAQNCMLSVMQGFPADQALTQLQHSDGEAYTLISQVATRLGMNSTQLIQDPLFIYKIIPSLRASDAGNQDDVPQIPARTLESNDPHTIVENAMNYLIRDPNAVHEVPIQLINGTDAQKQAFDLMTQIMNRLGTRNYYEAANHPSWRLVFLDIITPQPPIQAQQPQQNFAPQGQNLQKRAVEQYYRRLEESNEIDHRIEDDPDQDFRQTAANLEERIVVYDETAGRYTMYSPEGMDANKSFDDDDIFLKINADGELVQMVAAGDGNDTSGETTDEDDD